MEFTVQTVREARERIRDYVTETPLLRMEALDGYLGCQVYLKLENMATYLIMKTFILT